MDLRTTGSGSGPDAQDLRSLKGLLSVSIVFASRKPSHSRSALFLEALLSTGLHFGGNITWSGIRRDLPLNAVYVKFSVYTLSKSKLTKETNSLFVSREQPIGCMTAPLISASPGEPDAGRHRRSRRTPDVDLAASHPD
jgi:hypothetical protein